METFRLNITDGTSPQDMDLFFNYVWFRVRRKAHIVLDTTRCKEVSLRRVLSMKNVLNKHRHNSKNYIDHTTVIVKSKWGARLLRWGLKIIRTERPVKIQLLSA